MKKLTEFVERSNSCITGNSELEQLYSFKNFPIFMGCTNKPQEEDLVADMTWFIDPSSGFIQLTNLIPLDILYMDQHMDATGLTWSKYNLELSNFILNHSKENILEIGGGSGKLANLVLNSNNLIQKYIVVEPNPMFSETERLKVIKSFFSESLKIENAKISTIVLSQVLEHIYDPKDFLKQIFNFLPINGRFIFGYPNLEYLFENKFTNAINFEHTFLMTDYFVDHLLIEAGFKIVSKINYENHSHFYCVEKTKEQQTPFVLENKYDFYKKMFNDFIKFHESLVIDLNSKIENTQKPVFLFGAHIFSQYLLAFGLIQNKILNILDNSPIKIDKRLYGSSLEVLSPRILADYKEPIVILKAGLYNQEIIEDILTNINKETQFI